MTFSLSIGSTEPMCGHLASQFTACRFTYCVHGSVRNLFHRNHLPARDLTFSAFAILPCHIQHDASKTALWEESLLIMVLAGVGTVFCLSITVRLLCVISAGLANHKRVSPDGFACMYGYSRGKPRKENPLRQNCVISACGNVGRGTMRCSGYGDTTSTEETAGT